MEKFNYCYWFLEFLSEIGIKWTGKAVQDGPNDHWMDGWRQTTETKS